MMSNTTSSFPNFRMQPPPEVPYVGPQPFPIGGRLYGRDQEVRNLCDLLITRRVVLLHAPSGAGKTSLIQAGLIPKLKDDEKELLLLPIVRPGRLAPHLKQYSMPSINRYVFNTLLDLEEGLNLEEGLEKGARMSASELAEVSLNEYLSQRIPLHTKQAHMEIGEQQATLLIFDQLEEVLTADLNDLDKKRHFFKQVGLALLKRDRLALFAIRQEYVGALDPYLREIPINVITRFPLDLLRAKQAEEAILGPLKFSLALNFAGDLDKQQMSAALKARFKHYGRPLTDHAQVEVNQVQAAWTITDGDSLYAVRREDQALNVYLEPNHGSLSGRPWSYLSKELVNNLREVRYDRYLFSLRPDFAGELDNQQVSDELRAQFQSRQYPLGPTTPVQVDQAGRRWTIIHGNSSYVIREEDQALNVYVESITLSPYVEPVQLQVVCLLWWEKLKKGQESKPDQGLARGTVDNALEDYYNHNIQEIAGVTSIPESRIRDWIEKTLITKQGFRTQLQKDSADSEGLSQVIDKLIESYLVRKEEYDNRTWLELAHDRLIRPIRASNDKWRETHARVLQRQAALWQRRDKPEELLLRGKVLGEEAKWAEKPENRDSLKTIEKEFLKKSLDAKNSRQNALLIRALLILLLFVIVTLASGLFASQKSLLIAIAQQQEANTARTTATYAFAAAEMGRQTAIAATTAEANTAATSEAQRQESEVRRETAVAATTAEAVALATSDARLQGLTKIATSVAGVDISVCLQNLPDYTSCLSRLGLSNVNVLQTVQIELTVVCGSPCK